MEIEEEKSLPANPTPSAPRKFSGSKVVSVLALTLLMSALVGVSWFSGYYVGRKAPKPVSSKAPDGISNSTNKDIDFGLFWQAWNIIDEDFFGEKDSTKRLNGAISGMVSGLNDPYTVYLEPSESSLFKSDLEGSFGGIGAELAVKNNLLTIVAALEGTPADKAGLRGQDIILEVDGQKTADITFSEAITKIRGEKGTKVELTIVRAGVEKAFKVELIRDTIVVKSVKTSAIGEQSNIAYVKVNQFGQDTDALFTAALEDAKATGKKGLVIDLRNNPGGYLQTAVDMVGMVIPNKIDSTEQKLQQRVAVLERFKDGSERPHATSAQPILPDIPLVVIVNSGSASASEIFAGAMKDYQRATVLGTKTFGKGSVQHLKNLDNGGSIKVTVAKWFTPLGSGIDGKGVDPTVVVELPEKTEISTQDPQVTKALEILQKQIK